MSSCGSTSCGCGSGCSCNSSCACESSFVTAGTLAVGVAPANMINGAESDFCRVCDCDPCTCDEA